MTNMISIAMATYNGEKYIREQLDSILAQTYQNFEFIVCDDCSTDSTVQILREYEARERRIRVFVNEQNLGYKKNFEKAAGLCNGEYIAFSDQDDVWLPEHLEKLFSIIDGHDIACGNARIIDSRGDLTGDTLNELDDLYIFNPEKILLKMMFRANCFQGASMLVKSDFLRNTFPIPDGIKYHDSWLSYCACFEKGIIYTFDAVTKYRLHGNNITHNFKTHGLFFAHIIFMTRKFMSGVESDRFCYCEELAARYGTEREPFSEIYKIITNIENKRFGIREILFFWKNYEWIMTRKGHKGFLKKILIWSKWRKGQ